MGPIVGKPPPMGGNRFFTCPLALALLAESGRFFGETSQVSPPTSLQRHRGRAGPGRL